MLPGIVMSQLVDSLTNRLQKHNKNAAELKKRREDRMALFVDTRKKRSGQRNKLSPKPSA